MSLGQNAKPLSIEQVSAATVPVRQASAKLDDSLRLPIKAGQSEAMAYASESEPLWQVMLNREIDRCLSAFLRRVNENPADATLADLSITFSGKRT